MIFYGYIINKMLHFEQFLSPMLLHTPTQIIWNVLMLNRELHSCKICGYYDEGFLPWGLDGEFPLYEIYLCCEAKSGY